MTMFVGKDILPHLRWCLMVIPIQVRALGLGPWVDIHTGIDEIFTFLQIFLLQFKKMWEIFSKCAIRGLSLFGGEQYVHQNWMTS